MPRLSADLVLRAPSRINPLNERELDLRGNKIPAIENLGACQDQYDTIDFSDNEVGKLENFPLLNRIRSLLFHNNHITKITPNLGESLPKLETLLLTNNRIVNLSDLDSLTDLPTLRYLTLIDNVVSKKPNYRLYVIHKLPDLKILDYRKIKRKLGKFNEFVPSYYVGNDSDFHREKWTPSIIGKRCTRVTKMEREEAAKLFGQPAKKEKTKKKGQNTKTFVPGETTTTTPVPIASQPKVLEAQLAFKAALDSAQTMEEVERLERAVATGATLTTTQDAEMNEAEA